MHRPPPVVLAGLLLVAAVAGHAAEAPPSGGALDQTKAELRQLQTDQKNKAGQEGDKLKLNSPGLNLQGAGSDGPSPEAWLSEKLKQDRKLKDEKRNAKNWLVDGVEKLEKENAQAKDGAVIVGKDGEGSSQSEAHAIDQSDPQYLLKLFDEQKKPADNKSTAGKSPAATTPDAFAPFMQSWLASSPVKGQLLDSLGGKPEGGNAAPVAAPGDYRGPAGPANAPVVIHDTAAQPKENPYLADLNAPILTREVMQDAPQLQSSGLPAASADVPKGGPVLLPSAPPVEARERQKGPPPSPADDKKYFPQLKRF